MGNTLDRAGDAMQSLHGGTANSASPQSRASSPAPTANFLLVYSSPLTAVILAKPESPYWPSGMLDTFGNSALNP